MAGFRFPGHRGSLGIPGRSPTIVLPTLAPNLTSGSKTNLWA